MFALPDIADSIVSGLILSCLGLGLIIILVRVIGLRTFSKMTAFDFVITLATGSLLASVATMDNWNNFIQGVVAITVLMVLQVVLALYRNATKGSDSILENQPQLLMEDGEFIEDVLAKTRVSRDDVHAKLRAANVTQMSQVRAVVLETTGDISVLHGDSLQPDILYGVMRTERSANGEWKSVRA